MASLRKKPNSCFWIACYTDASGVRRQASTGKEDRKEAQIVADGFEEVALRSRSEAQVRKTMSDICERTSGKPVCEFTLTAWFDEYLRGVKPEIAASAYERYGDAFSLIRSVDSELCGRRIDLLTQPDIEALRPKLQAVRSAASTNFAVKVLRMALKRALGRSLILINPAVGVKRVKPNQQELLARGDGKKPFTFEQVKLLLSKADDEMRGMIVAGIFSAGQRLGDIATMKASQVDLGGGVVRFGAKKTNRPTVIPLTREWTTDLEARIAGRKPEDPVFPATNGKVLLANGKMTDVSKSFRRLLHKCGLAPKVGPRAGSVEGRRRPLPYSFHSFRHTMPTWMANAGVSKSIAMDLVGHENVAVHNVYTHIDQAPKLAAMMAATKGLRLARKAPTLRIVEDGRKSA